MRNRIRAADRRLPKAVQSLWYSEERLKRERGSTIAALNHANDPEPMDENIDNFDISGNSSGDAAVFRARGSGVPLEESEENAESDRQGMTIADESRRLTVSNADLSGSTFADVNLAGIRVRDALMVGVVIQDTDLSGAHFVDVNLTGVTIEDASIDGLTINGKALGSVSGREAVFESVSPIGSSDPMALPVKDVGAAVAYYVNVLGFRCVSSSVSLATLRRDSAEIGLSVSGADPDQASVYFSVSDIEALHRELTAKSASPSALREDIHGGQRYRVCFAREPYGVCFCFGQKIMIPQT